MTLEYVSSGDIRRPKAIHMPQTGNPTWCEQGYGYDNEGRLVSNTSACHVGQPLAIDYSYDSLNRIIGRTYPTEYGTLKLARRIVSDSIGIGSVVTSMKVDGVPVASQMNYDATGQVASLVFGEGNPQSTTDAFSYDPLTGRLSGQTVKRGSADLLNLAYGYVGNNIASATGQLTSLFDNLDMTRQRSYVYDSLGRLVTVQDPPYWRMAYEYDRYGSRTSTSVNGVAADGSTIPLDGLPSLSYNPATNHISTPGFLYDAAGNVTRSQRQDGSWQRYRYDAANHLAEVLTDVGVFLESYSYAADGRRLIVNSPGASGRNTYYAWDEDNAIGEYHIPIVGGRLLWSKNSIYLGNRVLATQEPNGSGTLTRYYHPDRLGVRLLTDDATANATTQVTLPFGTRLPGESSSELNPVFTSYERSFTTGLDYAVNRQDDPGARFTQVDPVERETFRQMWPQNLNLYTYADNDPVNKFDPLGLEVDNAGILRGLITISTALGVYARVLSPGTALALNLVYGLTELQSAGTATLGGIGASLAEDAVILSPPILAAEVCAGSIAGQAYILSQGDLKPNIERALAREPGSYGGYAGAASGFSLIDQGPRFADAAITMGQGGTSAEIVVKYSDGSTSTYSVTPNETGVTITDVTVVPIAGGGIKIVVKTESEQ